jgi:hypothetical protein
MLAAVASSSSARSSAGLLMSSCRREASVMLLEAEAPDGLAEPGGSPEGLRQR